MSDSSLLDNPTRVSSAVAPLLARMLHDSRLAYGWAAREALTGLERGTLLGIQSSWTRFWITLRCYRARPVRCATGALFQALEMRSPPRTDSDIVGWIVVQDKYSSGTLVLVHEIGHWLNRLVVRQRADQPSEVLDRSLLEPATEDAARWTRAQFLNELGARHLAWLAESGVRPGKDALPEAGALFACAVKIASYPDIYNDCGVMRRLVERGDPAELGDQVGVWMRGLQGFRFFEPGSPEATAHASWVAHEIEVAALGSRAPVVPAEGTL